MKKLKILFKRQEGQLLLEAIIALSILVIILVSISIVVIVAVNNSTFIKHQNVAKSYAQEAIEYLRAQYNNDYKTFTTYSGKYCMAGDNTLVGVGVGGDCTVNLGGEYIRDVRFDPNSTELECTPAGGSPQTKVTATVWWAGSKCPGGSVQQIYCHKSQLTTCFSPKDTGI